MAMHVCIVAQYRYVHSRQTLGDVHVQITLVADWVRGHVHVQRIATCSQW